jgi:patatin-related protein
MSLAAMAPAEWKAERDDAEVVRLALVLNGGVSLAVWIGGVTHELDRLRRAFEMEQTSTYAQLLRCLGSVVRIDVIGGASAGGLNGAMLASAIAYGRSLETAEAISETEAENAGEWMRERWLALGDLASIMRKPTNAEAGPSSLLDGDLGMLEPLRELVFSRLVPSAGPTDMTRCQPVTYVATTTDVVGDPARRVDDYGAEFVDREHRAMLQFSADPDNRWATARDDDFALRSNGDAVALARSRTATRAKLALAARSTSSFPLAFEPAHWDQDTDVASFSSSRYLADGGIFDNAPFDRVIDAIQARRATRLTHRVLAYVCAYDDPLASENEREFATAPTISAVLDLALNKPRDVSMTTGLARLDEMRRGQDDRVRPRDELVIAIASGPALTDLASGLFDGYQLSRLDLALGRIVRRVQRDLGAADPSLKRGIDRMIALDAAIDASVVPPAFGVTGEWRWGITAAKRGIDMLTDGLLYALALTPRDADNAAARADLRTSRDTLASLWCQLDRLDDEIEHAEATAYAQAAADEDGGWIHGVFGARRAVLDAWPLGGELALGPAPRERGSILEVLQGAIAEVRGRLAILEAAAAASDQVDDPARVRYVSAIAGLIGSSVAGAADAPMLTAIATLEVLSVALGASASTDTPRFEVKRMTARAYGPDGRRHEPGEKLAGLQLGHFGGFLKSSWRANDWMWGRLDAVDHITQLLLAPARLRRARHPSELAALLVELAGLAAGPEAAQVAACIEVSAGTSKAFDPLVAEAELETFRRVHLVPALQRPIISEEIPSIQAARSIDRRHDELPAVAPPAVGGAPTGPGPISSEAVDIAVAGLSKSEPDAAVTVLLATLARETVGANFPSPSLTRPTGDAIATGLQAFTTPANRLPGAAQAPLRGLKPLAFLFYGLSQVPTSDHLRRIYRTGGLFIAAILAAGALAFLAVYEIARWAADALFGGSRWLSTAIAIALIVVVTCAMGLLAARALTRATLQALKGQRAAWLPVAVSAAVGAVMSGALGLPGALFWLWRRGRSTKLVPYVDPDQAPADPAPAEEPLS